MTNAELALKWGARLGKDPHSTDWIEELRQEKAGYFDVTFKGVTERYKNIVTNQGLNYILTAALDGGTQITAWYVVLSTTNTTPLATHTYASPGFTEATTQVSETVRQAWTGGTVSSQSVDNSASPATYTAGTTVTMYGAALVGGGTAATTKGNTAGGGTLYAFSLFGSSKAMSSTDTIDVTYTFTQADDGA